MHQSEPPVGSTKQRVVSLIPISGRLDSVNTADGELVESTLPRFPSGVMLQRWDA